MLKAIQGNISRHSVAICDTVLVSLATISKHYRLGGLNNRHSFLTILETGKSKIKLSEDSVPDENPLTPGLKIAAFSLCSHVAEKGSKFSSVSSC